MLIIAGCFQSSKVISLSVLGYVMCLMSFRLQFRTYGINGTYSFDKAIQSEVHYSHKIIAQVKSENEYSDIHCTNNLLSTFLLPLSWYCRCLGCLNMTIGTKMCPHRQIPLLTKYPCLAKPLLIQSTFAERSLTV